MHNWRLRSEWKGEFSTLKGDATLHRGFIKQPVCQIICLVRKICGQFLVPVTPPTYEIRQFLPHNTFETRTLFS